jgi:cation diffusion facilitator CzcD-associated flavoprotein CzcO
VLALEGNQMSVKCDYLVVGSGASAMSFVDTILELTDASVVMVDRRAVPGGHWNDSYPLSVSTSRRSYMELHRSRSVATASRQMV